MKIFIMMGTVLLPSLAVGATDCRVVEYPDRYEAICNGDARPGSGAAQVAGPTPSYAQPQPPVAQQNVAAGPAYRQRRLATGDLNALKTERNKLILKERRKDLDTQNGGTP